MILDILTRTVRLDRTSEAVKLRVKPFSFLVYLALQRQDGANRWVEITDILRDLPCWRGLSARTAGKEIYGFLNRYAWFGCVRWHESTVGPYRLDPDLKVEFDRDAANLFIASMPERRRRGAAPRRQRRLSDTEIQTFDLLVQHGMYVPAVVDVALQRFGRVERFQGRQRLAAYRILVTLHKLRGHTFSAWRN